MDRDEKPHPDAYEGEYKSDFKSIYPGWFIEIDDLTKWVRELDCSIVLGYNNANDFLTITIYDDYLE